MPSERSNKGLVLNFDVAKALFDWALRLSPLIGFLVTTYLNQDRTIDRSKNNDKRITDLETAQYKLERELLEEKIKNATLLQRVEDQDKFNVLTGRH